MGTPTEEMVKLVARGFDLDNNYRELPDSWTGIFSPKDKSDWMYHIIKEYGDYYSNIDFDEIEIS